MHTRTCYLHCSTFLWEIAKSCAGWQLDASACTSSNSLDLRGARNADRKLRRPHEHARQRPGAHPLAHMHRRAQELWRKAGGGGAPAPAAAFSLRFRFNAAGHREVRGALARPARSLPQKRPCPPPPGVPQAASRRARGERGRRAARRWKACGPTRPWRRSLNTWTGGRPRQTRRPPPWTPRRSTRTPPARPARVQSAAARHGVPRRVTRTSRAIYMLRLRSLPQGSDRPLCWSPGRPCCPCIQDGLGALCAQLRFEDSHFPVDAEASSLGDAAVLLDRF